MPRRHHTTASKANESAWKGYAEFLEGQTEATKARLRAIANPGLSALRQSPVSIDLRHKLAEACPEKAHNLPPLQEIFHDFFQFAGRHGAEYPRVAEALALRKEAVTNYRFTKKDLAATLVGDAAEGQGRRDRILSAETIEVEKQSEPYPEVGWYIAESGDIYKTWDNWLRERKMPDSRVKRRLCKKLDESKLQVNLPADKSAIFIDASTKKLVGYVFRDWCGDAELVHQVNEIVVDAVEKSISKEDTGGLVLAGWSAGARSTGLFDWCNNLRKKNQSEDSAFALRLRQSSAFAIMWNMCLSGLPDEVLLDYEDWRRRSLIYPMDPAVKFGEEERVITVKYRGEDLKFHNATMAPPCGVFAVNYSRYIHVENQPHRWGTAWTTFRDPTKKGGSFFFSDYGIRVCPATDTLHGWEPARPHGTSLPNTGPDPRCKYPDVVQSGLSIVTSPRIEAAFRRFCESSGNVEVSALQEEFVSSVQEEEADEFLLEKEN
ncbi:hypothetical protein DFJ43DRAFT_987971 [Lentinula guzmanii]|uniref:Uncharacterized protein n=1 Tax=Lentinula guzmanii TaxID=2804957 RepID=A0AA38JR86_9AGAR|nr:hypothetical protein DFJ43DRAFT_987971 [Lentinula guzmanii]